MKNKSTFFTNLLCVITLAFLWSCQSKAIRHEEELTDSSHLVEEKSAKSILDQMKNPNGDRVLVVAHRGDWRNAPENSLKAVDNCIEMGVDIVEIDVKISKDGHLIVMHDNTLDRTTTGKGLVKDWPLDSIRAMFLKNGAGRKTKHPVPTLREVMEFVKDKPVLINLDKAWDYLPETYQLLKETGTVSQGIFKGNEPLDVMRMKYGNYIDSILYMPMVWPVNYSIYERESIVDPREYARNYIDGLDVIGFEVIFDKYNPTVEETISIIEKENISVWVNTLWDELCAGHTDDEAIEDPEGNWGWVISKGADIIQTDRPAMLLHYLREKGLHD